MGQRENEGRSDRNGRERGEERRGEGEVATGRQEEKRRQDGEEDGEGVRLRRSLSVIGQSLFRVLGARCASSLRLLPRASDRSIDRTSERSVVRQSLPPAPSLPEDDQSAGDQAGVPSSCALRQGLLSCMQVICIAVPGFHGLVPSRLGRFRRGLPESTPSRPVSRFLPPPGTGIWLIDSASTCRPVDRFQIACPASNWQAQPLSN